jgi:hypothetical protein
MTANLWPLFFIAGIYVVPLALLGVAIWCLRAPTLSRAKKAVWVGVTCVASVPLAALTLLMVWFAAENFPFTSGVIAHASSAHGEEACVVQTFKGAEPYQVSLYARRAGQPWVWHYLAHQDGRWRSCRIDFSEGQLRVYTGSTLRKSFSVSDAITVTGNSQLPTRRSRFWHNTMRTIASDSLSQAVE